MQYFLRRLTVLTAAVFIAQPAALASDQDAQTGSHLPTRTARPVILQINQTTTFDEVLRLLEHGRTEEAVSLARRYVNSFDGSLRISTREALPARYFALNALCVALTQHGEADAAADACSDAIRLLPERWSAINNRGTARYIGDRFGEALADYRLALRVAPPDPDIIATIEHNIDLTIARQTSSVPPP